MIGGVTGVDHSTAASILGRNDDAHHHRRGDNDGGGHLRGLDRWGGRCVSWICRHPGSASLVAVGLLAGSVTAVGLGLTLGGVQWVSSKQRSGWDGVAVSVNCTSPVDSCKKAGLGWQVDTSSLSECAFYNDEEKNIQPCNKPSNGNSSVLLWRPNSDTDWTYCTNNTIPEPQSSFDLKLGEGKCNLTLT